MSKGSKAPRTVKCGGCGNEGHNTRTCPSKEAPRSETATATATPPEPVVETKTEAKTEVPPPPVPKKTRIDTREARPRREAPTGDRGTAATAAPYRCPKCNQVAILVVVRVKDHVLSQRAGRDIFKGDQRCEQCLNKPDPTTLILKWGVKPGETVTEAEANATV
jgi:hypothetical protein